MFVFICGILQHFGHIISLHGLAPGARASTHPVTLTHSLVQRGSMWGTPPYLRFPQLGFPAVAQ